MLIQTHQLDNQQLIDLDLLCINCKSTDGNLPAIYRHLLGKDRGRSSNILYYPEPGKLAGFLGAFFFYEKSCEIALMVAPEYRRQGLASKMLKTILPLIKEENVETLVFSSPHELNDDWLTGIGFLYQGSEFQMQRFSSTPIASQNKTVNIRLATQDDIPILCAIDHACFSTQNVNMAARFYNLLQDPANCLFMIEQADTSVGKAHLNWQPNGARLSDIAVLPSLQGHGLGTALLTHCINHSLSKNKANIILDVETTNRQALGLYTQLGFIINNAHDYWNIDELVLTAFLNHL